jgi:spore coat polysaccharide biosynthesis predicted glycosyltransferase SpsG
MTLVHLLTTGGPEDGRGHVSRAVAMAEALTGAGAKVCLEVLRGSASRAQRDRLLELGVRFGPPDDEAVALVDLPDPNAIGNRWPPERLALFDDREWFRGEAKVVIQPSLATWSGSARAGRVLAGYDYAPIRSSLRQLAAEPVPESMPAEVVVCFGGSDPEDVSARLAPAIAAVGPWSTVVVVGPGYRGRLAETDPGVEVTAGNAGEARHPADLRVLRDPPDLDRRLARASLVVCGAGTMKFEIALLGRPMILMAAVDDQLPIGPPFAATGAARYLGDGRTIDSALACGAVAELMADEPARAAMAGRGRAVVDGRGADRVAAAVLDLALRAGGAQPPRQA